MAAEKKINKASIIGPITYWHWIFYGDKWILEMTKIEPPSFISEEKTFETYKRDLERWSKLTDVKPELQAILVIYYLDGDPSSVKEKIDNGVEEKELNTTKGV